MNRLDETTEQTAIRRALLANGYTPLANKDKMCVLHGWPSLYVDEAQIEVWSQQLKWRATGVRVERGLVVIDLDVNDAGAVDAIIDALPDHIWDILQHAPVRRGKGAKEAWFCRLSEGEESFYRLASAGFRQADGDETVHRVEIFAGDEGGRQFGAYGAHTIGSEGDIAVSYQWTDGRDLREVRFADLPRLTRKQLAEVADTATRALDELGWQPDLKSKSGFSSNVPVYDLDDQVFETQEGGALNLAELEAACAVSGQIRLSASWLEGPSATNPTRCIASLSPSDNRVSIFETASFTVHRPKDMGIGPKLARLAAYFARPEVLLQYETSTFWSLDDSQGADVAASKKCEIYIASGGIAVAVMETAQTLENAGDTFDFGDQIAIVRGQSIIVLNLDRLTFELGSRIRYFRPNTEGRPKDIEPPPSLVKQLIALGHERGLPPLLGLIDMPIILPNGRLVSVAGYNPASRLYLAPFADNLPTIQDNPSPEQLRKALNTLWEPFKDFPFVSRNDRGGMLAALLTAVLRKALPTAPAFGFDAPTQGSGKTLLAKCVGELTGEYRLAAPLPTKNEEELAKVLVSTLITGPRAVIFDNQLGTLDSASFAAALTSQIYEGRQLGASKMVKLPTNCVFMLTGNNLSMGGDMPRRIVKIRIDAAVETPFTRVFDFDPEIYVRENRTTMVGAALTLVQAALPHSTAGRLGSFEDWDRMVAQTVVWVARTLEEVSFGDPYDLVGEGFRTDPHREDLIALLEGLRGLFGNERFTARDLREHLTPGSSAPLSLRDVVESFCVRLNANAIGQMLRHRVGRRVAGLYLVMRPNEKTANQFQVLSEVDLPNETIVGTANAIPIRLAAVMSAAPKCR